ncbi:MAG: hypothetical protein HFJ09_03470 [Lachnospiraceae bacterium]|nr:hypothetical protein [Lachnospiraceae bacterium]
MIQIQNDNGYATKYFSIETVKKQTEGEFSQKMQKAIEEGEHKNLFHAGAIMSFVNPHTKEIIENFHEDSDSAPNEVKDCLEFIRERINEIFIKVQNGDIEPSYQIGGQSFTEKEWNELLEKFDNVIDAMKALAREEREQQIDHEKSVTKNIADSDEKKAEMLTMESFKCSEQKQDKKIVYIIAYDINGIRCKRSSMIGEEGYLWEIPFSNKEQYQRVCKFMNQFSDDVNLPFASHQNFWEDFLEKKIDIEDFLEFFLATKDGVPDYTYTIGDSTFIDREKVKYAKYMNPLGSRFYSEEEMKEMQNEVIRQATKKMLAEQKSPTEHYRVFHPEYNGERIFCMYPGGVLYNAEEIAELMMENVKRN